MKDHYPESGDAGMKMTRVTASEAKRTEMRGGGDDEGWGIGLEFGSRWLMRW